VIFQPTRDQLSAILSRYEGRRHLCQDDEPIRGRYPTDDGVRGRIRKLLRKSGPMCATDVALKLGIGRGSASAAMSAMRKEGMLKECRSLMRPNSRRVFYEVA